MSQVGKQVGKLVCAYASKEQRACPSILVGRSTLVMWIDSQILAGKMSTCSEWSKMLQNDVKQNSCGE